jgi:aspartate/methionine/tyrosine aminotransferase
VGPATGWALTPGQLDAAGPLAGVVVASPSNPTGAVLADPELRALADWCGAHGVRLVSDEIYHGITYGRRAGSAAACSSEAIVVSSFSKYFCMTGWRLGWIVAPSDLVVPLERFQQNLYICAPTLSQLAATAAFDCEDELDGHVRAYAANRELLLAGLSTAGLTDVAAADGAFYVYADVSRFGRHSMDLCRDWLETAGVATTPGIDFDLARGGDHVRFSYSGSADTITDACARLTAWVGARR